MCTSIETSWSGGVIFGIMSAVHADEVISEAAVACSSFMLDVTSDVENRYFD